MGIGADYTEFTINSGGTINIMSPSVVITSGYITGPEMGHFAVDVHEVGSVSIVNTSGYYIAVHEIGVDRTEFTVNSGGTISIMSPTFISGHIGGHFATDVHEIGSVPVIGNQGLPFRQGSSGTLFVIDQIFQAVEVAFLHDTSQPAANTNIFTSGIISDISPVDFRIQIIMSNSGNFSVVITNGGNSQIGLLNNGTALTAGVLYTFDILVHKGDTINFQYSSTGGTIRTLRIQEIDASSY